MSSIAALFAGAISIYVVYLLFIRQLLSPHRHLPTAKQPCLLHRLFHAPTTFELEQWRKETPNNGLIRYFGFMNSEKLLVTSPEMLKHVLQRESYKYDKAHWLAAYQSPVGVSGLVSAAGDLHKFHRRHTIAAFNSTSVRKLYPEIWRSVLLASNDLSRKVSDSAIMKVNPFLQLACLQTALSAGFSKNIDVLGDPEQLLIKNYWYPFHVGKKGPLFSKLLHICPEPIQHFAAAFVARCVGINITLMRTLIRSTVHDRLEKIKDEEFDIYPAADEEQPQDVLEGLLRVGYKHLSEASLFRHAMTTLSASLEMPSGQLSWAIYALSHPRNIHVQERLRSEIRRNFPVHPETLSWEQVKSQKYLNGVVNEVLRLYPNVVHRDRVCNTSTRVQDVPIPRGTVLTIHIYGTNRQPEIWGPDAGDFEPERWFPENEGNGDGWRRDAFAFMTFGQGPRKCPGEHYTRTLIACMLFEVVGRFHIRRAKGYSDVIEDDNAERVGVGLTMKADIWVNVKEVLGWDNSP